MHLVKLVHSGVNIQQKLALQSFWKLKPNASRFFCSQNSNLKMTESMAAPPTSAPESKKRQLPSNGKKPKRKIYKSAAVDPISSQGVLRKNIKDVFPDAPCNDMTEFYNRDRSIEWHLNGKVENLEIKSLSHNGLGIGFDDTRNRVILVPYTFPGDVVNANVCRTEEYYLMAELISVVTPASIRDNSLAFCKYFGEKEGAGCAGCQYQYTAYSNQLEIKRQVIVNAYKYFAPELEIPTIQETVASPLEKKYRTKLTPHFDVPKKGLASPDFPIGFGHVIKNQIVDIEECSLGTDVINTGIKQKREEIKKNYKQYKRGVTLLFREGSNESLITDPKAIMQETVGKYVFEYKAGEFFQNNNSILPIVTNFVAENLKINGEPPQYLVDTYCGCGLFAITCSSNAKEVVGVEISAQNVEFARSNAEKNNVSNAEFIVGQAERIFERVNKEPELTSVVIDPPRKGCDKLFLDQLLQFGPARIVYVSCNVHSQARDIDYFIKESNGKYKVESLRGFDFFPQTYHVESVAVLSRTS